MSDTNETLDRIEKAAAATGAHCVQEGHSHATRAEEALCSLVYQRDGLRRELSEARREIKALRTTDTAKDAPDSGA